MHIASQFHKSKFFYFILQKKVHALSVLWFSVLGQNVPSSIPHQVQI
uniref:Uncharacterized protein n=1 Tax=Anguilla anguilla TaxID=7936 RepID=A0A0E9V5H4_ANGAN